MEHAADRAFERLYVLHRAELYRWLLRETGDPATAEDVVQTAFLHAYRALREGEPPREPRSWLYAIARNANRGRFRRQRVVEAELDEDLPLTRDETALPELRDALAKLPQNQRSAILLQEVAGLSYAEIGERLGVTVGSVQMLVFRARRRLRDELLGRRRRAGLWLPVQTALNALSRLSAGGDRAVLIRGAAGIAGAVAIGGGVLALPGDRLPAQAKAAPPAPSSLVQVAPTTARASSSPEQPAQRAEGARGSKLHGSEPGGGSGAAAGNAPGTPAGGQASPAAGDSAAGSGSGSASSQGQGAGEAGRLPVPAAASPAAVPSVSVPAVSAPSVTVPSATVPSVSVPPVSAPSVSAPSVTVPSVTAPSVTVPSVTAPTVTAPSVGTPTVTVPSVSVPAAPAPPVQVEAPVPPASVPQVQVPPVQVPSVQAPPAPAPQLPVAAQGPLVTP